MRHHCMHEQLAAATNWVKGAEAGSFSLAIKFCGLQVIIVKHVQAHDITEQQMFFLYDIFPNNGAGLPNV